MSSKLSANPKQNSLLKRFSRRALWITLAVVILLGAGGYTYYKMVYLPARTTTTTATLQTTFVRQGDIVLSASGTGTLMPATQLELGFGTSGKIITLNVKVGDQVEKGKLIAELDNTSQQIQYAQAKRSLAELTSTASIAQAEQNVATAIGTVSDAKNQLIYFISPRVFYDEQQIAAAQEALDQAKAESGTSPTSDQQKKIDAATSKLKSAQAALSGDKIWYKLHYLPNNFTVTTRDKVTRLVSKSVQGPTDSDIATARAAYTVAQATLQEAQWYLDKLNGKDIPDNATGTNLTALEQAQLNLRSAEATLKATQIFAPISGTVMSVSAQLGDTVSSGAIITIADMSKLYLQTYVDESDYEKFKAGSEANIVFDALPDQTFKGKVVQVDPALNTSSGSSVVSGLVEMDPTSTPLLMGMGASVDVIAGNATGAVLVPVQALHEYSPGKYAVFVMQNGKLSVQMIEIGLKDAVNAEVKSGLNPGEEVSTGVQETVQ